MSSGRNTVTVHFAIIGGVLLVGLILFAPWPLWASLVPTLALVTAGILLVKTGNRRSSPSPTPEPTFTYVAAPPVERRQERVDASKGGVRAVVRP
jgi:hypothetical protein